MKKPKCVVLVAETECCGIKVCPTEPVGAPVHPWKEWRDGPWAGHWVLCKIVRVWEFEAKRLHVMKAQISVM